MIYRRQHNRMGGELLAEEMVGDLIMTLSKLQKWPKQTIAHHLKMQTLIIYKLITLVLTAERVLVARGRQQDKVLVVVTRTD